MLVPSCRRTLPSCTLGHCGKPWQRRVASLFKSIIFSPPTCRQQVWPFAALAVMFSTALSAVEPLPGQELLRQQERERIQRERLEPSPDVRFELPQALSDSDHLPEQEVPCFIIHQIQLLGENASDFQWALHAANPEADPALGRCLGAAGINLSMKRIQNAIVARGYVTTRILAEPQDLNAGTLRLTLVPGRIRNIRFAEDSSSRATLWNAMPANPGDLLNLRDIEQALENFKRVPTSEADIQIVPAEGDHAQPGESDVLIHWKQKLPLRLSLSLDDSGSESTGKYQGNVALSLDHLLTLNDHGVPFGLMNCFDNHIALSVWDSQGHFIVVCKSPVSASRSSPLSPVGYCPGCPGKPVSTCPLRSGCSASLGCCRGPPHRPAHGRCRSAPPG